MSPSRRYSLEIIPYAIGRNHGNYTRGIARETRTGTVVADVKRNFRHFPYSWAEDHPAGHSYLVCGEDYQGQTVIELDTGQRRDYIPREAEQVNGFCWMAHYPSPDGRFLYVEGCYWGASCELVAFDFSAPLLLPYREIKRSPVSDVAGFTDDGSFVFEYRIVIRKSDGKPTDAMTEQELEEFEADENYAELCDERTVRMKWHPNGREEVIGYRNDPPAPGYPA